MILRGGLRTRFLKGWLDNGPGFLMKLFVFEAVRISTHDGVEHVGIGIRFSIERREVFDAGQDQGSLLILKDRLQTVVHPMEVPLEIDDIDIIDSYSMSVEAFRGHAAYRKAME